MDRNEWLASLNTGDRVAVVAGSRPDAGGRVIYTTTVRRTAKHLYLDNSAPGRSWTTGFRDDAGAGPRCIVPVSP